MSPPWNIWNTNDINFEDDVAFMKHMKYKRYQPWILCRLHETWNTNDINLEDYVASILLNSRSNPRVEQLFDHCNRFVVICTLKIITLEIRSTKMNDAIPQKDYTD